VRDEECTEKHYDDICDLSKKREDKVARNENENAKDNTIRDASGDNETMNDDVFHDLI